MPKLERLRADHADAVLAFEIENRAWFARSISDRGDDFFARFAVHHQTLLDEQESGLFAFYVLVDEAGAVIGRFNLVQIGAGSAELGYRVAERVAGKGVATAAVGEICRLAVDDHGLGRLRAATSLANVASQRVLLKSGFVEVGPADPEDVGGKPGTWYEKQLVPA